MRKINYRNNPGVTFLVVLSILLISSLSFAASSVKLQLLSPQPQSNVEIDDVILVFSVLEDMEKVSLDGIKLEIDGIDVSPSVQMKQGVISFLPLDIKLGSHTVTLNITDTSGQMVEPLTFAFNVVPSTVKYKAIRTTPIIRFSGQNSMGFSASDVTGPGASARQQPSSNNNLNITATGSYQGINYEATAQISSQSSFNSQPSDQYAIRAYTNWGGIKAGDNFPSYGKLVLSGARVRGASIYAELNSDAGRLRVDGVYGTSTKMIEAYKTPQRDMQAFKASYDYNSIVKLEAVYLKSNDVVEDTLFEGVSYQENSVFGASFQYMPSYDFMFSVDWATSDTTDLRADTPVAVDTDSEPFIGNNGALDASFSTNIGTFYSINASYSITGLDYKSFGNPWKRTDAQIISASNTFKFFQGMFSITASYTLDKDNLSENLATTTTTETYASNATLTLGSNMPTVTGSYSMNLTQSDSADYSSLSQDRETINWSANLTEMLYLQSTSLTLRANYGENNSEDLLTPYNSMNSANYGSSIKLTLPNYASFGASYSVNENTMVSANSTSTTDTIKFDGSYPLIEQVLNLTGYYQIDIQQNNLMTTDNEKNALSFTLTWTINQFQQLGGTYSYINYSDLLYPDSSNYKSNTIGLSYTIMFSGFQY